MGYDNGIGILRGDWAAHGLRAVSLTLARCWGFLFAGLREFVSKVTALGAGIHD